MKAASLVLAIVLSSTVAYANTTYKIYSATAKKYEEKKFKKENGVLTSTDCFAKKALPCDALKATKTKKKLEKREKISLLGHPAAQYCHAHNANNRILIGPKGIEDDFCVFKDGSMVMAWDLYNAHFKKK